MFIDADRCWLCMWLLEGCDCLILWTSSQRGGRWQVTFMCLHGMFIDTRWSKWHWRIQSFRICWFNMLPSVLLVEPTLNKAWIVWPLTNVDLATKVVKGGTSQWLVYKSNYVVRIIESKWINSQCFVLCVCAPACFYVRQITPFHKKMSTQPFYSPKSYGFSFLDLLNEGDGLFSHG